LAWRGVNSRRAQTARVKIVDKIGGGKRGNNFDRIVIARLKSAMRAQPGTVFIERMYPAEASKRAANMAQALQVSMELHGGEMHAASRVAILGRYHRYSDLRKEIQSAALGNVSESSFLAYAKRIGLSDGKVLFADDDIELTLVFDLALYAAQAGRTRAIDRCARKRSKAAEPDEALVLRGLQASRFSIFRVIGRCEPAGVLLEDLMRGGTMPLLDEGMERSARRDDVFAMRVAPIEDFVITCGVVVPFNGETFEEVIDVLTDGVPVAERAALVDRWRFAASLYELAIELGLMNLVAYRYCVG
jgi:hypothetical protein